VLQQQQLYNRMCCVLDRSSKTMMLWTTRRAAWFWS